MKLLNKNTLILLFLISVSYPFLIKYVFVQHNQYVDIPMIWRILDRNYLPSDWVLNYNDLFSPRFFFVRYIAAFCHILPLTVVYFINYLMSAVLVTFSTFLVTWKIYRSRMVSYLTTITILFGQVYTFGGNYLIGRDLDPNGMAFALVIAGFSLLLYGKYYLAALLFTAANYLHILIGTEAPLIFFSVLFIYNIYHKKNKTVRFLIKSSILYLLLSGYSFYVYISSYFIGHDPQIRGSLLVHILTKIRAPFHYLPSSWPIINFAIYIFMTVLTFFFFRLYYKENKSETTAYIKLLFPVIVLLNIVSYFFTELWPVYSLIALQFYRMNVLLFWSGAMIIFGGCFLFIKNISGKHPFLSSSAIIFPFILARPETVFVPGPTHFLYLFFSVFFCFVLLRLVKSNIVLVVSALLIFYLPFRHYKSQFSELYPMNTPEIDVANWAKINTPKDTVFLTPVDFFYFKMNSERATVVNIEDMPFHPRGMEEWFTRLADASGLDLTTMENATQEQILTGTKKTDYPRIVSMSEKYKFQYAILDKNIKIPLSVIYGNDLYNVYKFD